MKLKLSNFLITTCNHPSCTHFGDRCQLFKKNIDAHGNITYRCAVCKSNAVNSCRGKGQYFDNEDCSCKNCSDFDNPTCPTAGSQPCCTRCNKKFCTGCNLGVGLEIRTATMGCRICQAGTYSDSTTDGTCHDCPPGTYQDAQRQDHCKKCEKGHKCPGWKNTNMTKCPPGTYQDEEDKEICKECEAGYKCPGEGNINMTPCPIGTYQDKKGEEICKNCPPASTTNNIGATSIAQCICSKDGLFKANHMGDFFSDCRDCGAGHYCPDRTNRYDCPAGTYCPNINHTYPPACDAGYYCLTGSEKKSCPGPGTSNAGSTSCDQCSCTGYKGVQYRKTGCRCICPVGYYRLSSDGSCKLCDKGYYCGLTDETRYTCPAGTYNNKEGQASSTSCSNCPAGSYNGSTGQAQCTKCPQGFFSTSATGCTTRDCACIDCGAKFNKGCIECTKDKCTKCTHKTLQTAILGDGKCYRRMKNASDCPRGTNQYYFTNGADKSDGSTRRCIDKKNRGETFSLMYYAKEDICKSGEACCWKGRTTAPNVDGYNGNYNHCTPKSGLYDSYYLNGISQNNPLKANYGGCERIVCNQYAGEIICADRQGSRLPTVGEVAQAHKSQTNLKNNILNMCEAQDVRFPPVINKPIFPYCHQSEKYTCRGATGDGKCHPATIMSMRYDNGTYRGIHLVNPEIELNKSSHPSGWDGVDANRLSSFTISRKGAYSVRCVVEWVPNDDDP